MKTSRIHPVIAFIVIVHVFMAASCREQSEKPTVHVWESIEIELEAEGEYSNPYMEVVCGVNLEGPDFNKKVYGFWDGDNIFRVRVLATSEGDWSWESFSNQDDEGLNGLSGTFSAVSWSEKELHENPNRLGFIQPTPNGRALQYPDGTPFFLLSDTWWAAATWRYPFKGSDPDPGYIPAEGMGFEEAVQFRKKQDFNSIAFITCFPNWQNDGLPRTLWTSDTICIRNAWPTEGSEPLTAKAMHDEAGNMPFHFPGRCLEYPNTCANFDSINPAYFQNLDKKIRYLSDQGFVPFMESFRRDHAPSWKAYHEFNESFSRFIQYLSSRYGSYNIIFSGIHFDHYAPGVSIRGQEFKEALDYHHETYGPPPFWKVNTAMADESTLFQYGHGDTVQWLKVHGVGNNNPRAHNMYRYVSDIFALEDPLPCINQEPYYPYWQGRSNIIGNEKVVPGSDRDHYFARACMYGSVLSGCLGGHLYGSTAYDGNSTGDYRSPVNGHLYTWEHMMLPSSAQMKYFKDFITSEQEKYIDCQPMHEMLEPRITDNKGENSLDGWAYLMGTPEKDLFFAYFENGCDLPVIEGLTPRSKYKTSWYNTIDGTWLQESRLEADQGGSLEIEPFPDGLRKSATDWGLKLVRLD